MVVYRGEDGGLTSSRLQAAEHEALVTLLAQRAGVSVPDVLAAASTSGEVAILATRRRGVRLDSADVAALADPDLVRLWQDLARLHDAGISHGALDVGAVRQDEHGLVIADFAAGSLHPMERAKRLDTARLLFGLAQLLGVERAVATARTGLGDDRLERPCRICRLPLCRRASGGIGGARLGSSRSCDPASSRRPGSRCPSRSSSGASALGTF